MNHEQYQSYLESETWAEKRNAIWARAGGRCENQITRSIHETYRCRSPGNDVHHKTYDRVGHELLGDLILVCGRCHKLIHAGLRYGALERHLLKREKEMEKYHQAMEAEAKADIEDREDRDRIARDLPF